MLYFGIDQHARQFTVSLRDENGDVVLARQVQNPGTYAGIAATDGPEKHALDARRYPYAPTPKGDRLRLTNSFRNA